MNLNFEFTHVRPEAYAETDLEAGHCLQGGPDIPVPAPRIRGYKDHGGLFGSYQWGYPRAQALQYLRWLNDGHPKGFEPEFL